MPSRSFVAGVGALAIIFAFVARLYFRLYPVSIPAAVGIYSAFTLLLALSLFPACGRDLRGADATAARSRLFVFCVVVWCAPYVIYAAATGDFRWTALLRIMTTSAVPAFTYTRFPPKDKRVFTWQDAVVALVLVGSVLSGQIKGIWNVPTNMDFMTRLFLIMIASWSWTFLRVVPELGYSFTISREVLRQAAIQFALFAVIAIPSSLAMHFTRWNPRWPGLLQFLLNYLEIFLFIAVLEELFFRGFLQTLLSNTLRSWVAGQALVSVVFGLFHILHAPFPNWRYVALATVAGWFYGSAFRKTGTLMAPSLLHAAVDTVWRTWLSAR